MLPIALGEATKTVPFVMDGSKAYRFTIVWGAETDTDDADGTVTEKSDKRPSRAEIEAALPAFTGTISQLPPRYSALKVDGARAYDLARENEEFELQPRDVTIDRLSLVDALDADHAVLEAECGKGTYVRAIARDIGRVLGALGHVGALRRTRVGPFDEAAAIPLDDARDTGTGRVVRNATSRRDGAYRDSVAQSQQLGRGKIAAGPVRAVARARRTDL